MKYLFSFLIVVMIAGGALGQTQGDLVPKGTERPNPENPNGAASAEPKKDIKATIDMYRIITLDRDTTYVDTSLTIQDQYKHNYLRKDIFGLLPFANDGQTYQRLDFGTKKYDPYPDFGHSAKAFPYLAAEDIRYYSMATPYTDLYYRSVLKRGQNTDAFLSANINPQLNFSIAYKGLRSDGRYLNQISSTGNFRLTTSYHTKSKRYVLNAHFTSFDFSNQENGGIANINDFLTENPDYKNPQSFIVYSRDAVSFMKGKRLFIDHDFRANGSDSQNNLHITHQFSAEGKFFEYKQTNLAVALEDGTTIQRYGASYRTSAINDQTHYNKLYNKVGAVYENKTLGKFKFFLEDFRYNYYFDRVIINQSGINSGLLSDQIQTVGGEYEYRKNKWTANALVSQSITDQSLSNIRGRVRYQFDQKNEVVFQYERMNKIPDHIFNMNQSSYIGYNWSNNFKNEKINNISIKAETQWLTAAVQVSSYKDMLYFANTTTSDTLLVKPMQYANDVKYLSVKIGRDFKFGKFGLDNTFLYQQVDQSDAILNVPKFVTRNTVYFQDHYFSRALFVQTGVTFNYFTKYYANEYNPVLGEFFVQDKTQIGDFPLLDFFLDMRIRTARIFFMVEHFNASFSEKNYLTSPTYPYRDMTIRVGIEWNFFK